MNRIDFHNVVPHAFEHRQLSEVWGREASFLRGHFYLLEADSGAGKSTFCSYCVGLRSDYEGTISFDDTPTKGWGARRWTEIRKSHVSLLFQELRLFPELSAMENVLLKNRLTGFKSQQIIDQWFERLCLSDKRDEPVGHLSFGQQQRVALMRSLAQPFDFLLADEPVSHLDDSNSQLMGELIVEEARAQGAGVIATSIGRHLPIEYERRVSL